MENEVKNLDSVVKEIVSKSRLKRDSQKIQKLGKRLAALTSEQLAKIPLDEPVRDAIALAHGIQNKRSALKRHFQFIGKLLRARDTSAISAALEKLEQANLGQIQRHHRVEHWRDEIIDRGLDAIEEYLLEQASADRQKLRQLWRNYSTMKNVQRKTHIARLIYKEVLLGFDD